MNNDLLIMEQILTNHAPDWEGSSPPENLKQNAISSVLALLYNQGNYVISQWSINIVENTDHVKICDIFLYDWEIC